MSGILFTLAIIYGVGLVGWVLTRLACYATAADRLRQSRRYQYLYGKYEDERAATAATARLHAYRSPVVGLLWPLAVVLALRAGYAEAKSEADAVALRQSTRALKAAEKKQKELAAARAEAQAVIDRMTGGAA